MITNVAALPKGQRGRDLGFVDGDPRRNTSAAAGTRGVDSSPPSLCC